MKLATYNIQYSKGKDGRFELERIADAVRDADVVCLQEVVRNVDGLPDPDQPARLAELLPDRHWVYGPCVDLDASTVTAAGTVDNRRRQFGLMVLSRWPILSSRLLLLPRVRTYDATAGQRGALEAIIAAPGGPVRLYSVHLDHLNSRSRRREIRDLLPRLFAVQQDGASLTGPGWFGDDEIVAPTDFMVLGDFNLTPESGEYVEVVGDSDYYYGPMVAADRLVDAWTQAGHGIADGITWYDERDDFATGLRLDYCFVTAGLASRVKAAWIDDTAVGSDHQPTWFEIAEPDDASGRAGNSDRARFS